MVLRSDYVEGEIGFEVGESWGGIEVGRLRRDGGTVPGIGTIHDEHFFILNGLHVS